MPTIRPLSHPTARLLNHVEFIYAPGERALVRQLFEALGFRVLDPQTDPCPPELGPAAGPYLIVFLDPEDEDLIDNVIYASEAGESQWRLESAIRARMTEDPQLAALHRAYQKDYEAVPQAMTHVGIGYPDGSEIKQVLARLADSPALSSRIKLSDVFEPGQPGSVDDRVVQAFVYTDLISVGLLYSGQQLELQARLDGI